MTLVALVPGPCWGGSGIIGGVESPERILEQALVLPVDSQERWEYVVALHKRGDAATFRAAAGFLESPESARRILAADVLAQLGAERDIPVEKRPFAAPAAQLLIDHLPAEQDAEVLAAIATAFGHLNDTRCVSFLHGLRGHADRRVRLGVMFGLLGDDDDVAVQTLIELSTDADAGVRDWATFGLGAQIERDDPLVRDALIARLEDPDVETRGEAIRGLAARGEGRVIPALLRELENRAARKDPSLIEQALLALASKAPDKQLCEQVRELHRRWRRDYPTDLPPRDLQTAIVSCKHSRADLD